MKIGIDCKTCGSDHWIVEHKKGKARCGICFPSKICYREEWPRIIKVLHTPAIRKSGKQKMREFQLHRVYFSDLELAKAVSVTVDKVRTERDSFYYRVTPVFKHEMPTHEKAKGVFLRKRRR